MSLITTAPTQSGKPAAAAAQPAKIEAGSLSVHPLRNEDRVEVLDFLAARPLHTVVMAGHIRDNGVESLFNRGDFYACRDGRGELEGVALLGHATLMETRSEAALAAFARLAQGRPEAHLIMGEREKVERFWRYYARDGQEPRRVCSELLLEQRWPTRTFEPVPELRLATLAEMQEVMLVQGEMALDESGINPLEVDLAGFSERCARRIEQGRVWVWMEGGRLIFKADVISDTPEAIYLEGVYVNPQERGRGYGARCLSQLARTLLRRTGSLCILVNEQSQRARTFFERMGYRLRSQYDTIFLEGAGASE